MVAGTQSLVPPKLGISSQDPAKNHVLRSSPFRQITIEKEKCLRCPTPTSTHPLREASDEGERRYRRQGLTTLESLFDEDVLTKQPSLSLRRISEMQSEIDHNWSQIESAVNIVCPEPLSSHTELTTNNSNNSNQ
ncbi:hypothetical protein H4Q26_016175 [Puccinia striiformis f. sp. tritici PST-130]|nr:hypothetical protein H4Q26_016175 [Puccinia striiformis f. sp. tritici PST-130]